MQVNAAPLCVALHHICTRLLRGLACLPACLPACEAPSSSQLFFCILSTQLDDLKATLFPSGTARRGGTLEDGTSLSKRQLLEQVMRTRRRVAAVGLARTL